MLQDGRTKDVFRELDGFLVLMSALAAMGAPTTPGPVVEPPEQVLADTLGCTRLAFMVLSEAMYLHSENADYFNVSRKTSFVAHHSVFCFRLLLAMIHFPQHLRPSFPIQKQQTRPWDFSFLYH